MGGSALLLQPGQCPLHETGGRRNEAKNLSVPDLARPELVSLEFAGDSVLWGAGTGASSTLAPMRQRDGTSGGATIGFFLLLWIAVWAILFLMIKKMTPSGYVLGAVTTILCIAAGWLFVNYTPTGQSDNHVLAIGVGGGFGIVMLFNVWGIIWPNNKKIIRGTLAGAPPANAAIMARQAFLASRTNFFLSVPLLFFMATQLSLRDLREVVSRHKENGAAKAAPFIFAKTKSLHDRVA